MRLSKTDANTLKISQWCVDSQRTVNLPLHTGLSYIFFTVQITTEPSQNSDDVAGITPATQPNGRPRHFNHVGRNCWVCSQSRNQLWQPVVISTHITSLHFVDLDISSFDNYVQLFGHWQQKLLKQWSKHLSVDVSTTVTHCYTVRLTADLTDSGRRLLRSAVARTCVVPRTHNTYVDKSFTAANPRVWSSLPPNLRRDISYGLFKQTLKTFLFWR